MLLCCALFRYSYIRIIRREESIFRDYDAIVVTRGVLSLCFFRVRVLLLQVLLTFFSVLYSSMRARSSVRQIDRTTINNNNNNNNNNSGVTEEEAAQAVEKKTASWCCLDYARLVDTLRFALRGVKVELERLIDGGTFEESYVCKNREECAKRFSALDTARLFDAKRGGFVCDTCGTDVVRAGEENDGEDGNNGGGDPNATDGVIAKESKQALKLKMKRFSDQIAGIERQIAKCLRYPAPSYGTLQEYVVAKKRTKEAKEAAAMGQSGGQGYWGSIGVARGTQAFEQRLEETTFEIQIGDENGENGDEMNKGGAGDGQEKKEMPEWITRELQVDEEGKQTKKRKVEGADDAEKAKETTDADAVQEQYAKALLAALQAQQRDTTEHAEAKAEDAREKEGGGADVEMKAAEEAGGGDEEEEEEWEEA